MTLLHILVFYAFSAVYAFLPSRLRPWLLLGASLGGVIWLSSDGNLTDTHFMLILMTTCLTISVWWLIRAGRSSAADFLTLAVWAVIMGVVIVVGFMPQVDLWLMMVGMLGAAAVGTGQLVQVQPGFHKQAALYLIGLMIVLLVILKTPALAQFYGALLDGSPLVWLGFSYVSFRLIAVLLDYNAGRIPPEGYPLRDFMVYVLFFPAFTAGPIDRAQRFIPELQQAQALDVSRFVEGTARIAVGIFKKFVIADTLALVSLNISTVQQADTAIGLWVLVYIYALQIFFDFSGYSDVAIGLGRLYGITLPENFDRPYLQRNLQQFWQRWHMTLSTWFRVYYFTPFTRALIQSRYKPPQWMIVLSAQVTTMLLIGLWHGVTLNFVLWGAWHGLGLFAHKMLADNTRAWTKRVNSRVWSRRLIYAMSVFATFHFVALGWVFFALTGFSQSFDVLRRLFGVGW